MKELVLMLVLMLGAVHAVPFWAPRYFDVYPRYAAPWYRMPQYYYHHGYYYSSYHHDVPPRNDYHGYQSKLRYFGKLAGTHNLTIAPLTESFHKLTPLCYVRQI